MACMCGITQRTITSKPTIASTMNNIRLRWLQTRNTTVGGQHVECGPWCPDTEASRRELGEILDAGLQVCGEGSHWIETREAPTLIPMRNPFLALPVYNAKHHLL
jgi:hypothetical protein